MERMVATSTGTLQAPKLEEEIIVTVPTESIIKESSPREGHKEAEEAIALAARTVP